MTGREDIDDNARCNCRDEGRRDNEESDPLLLL